MVEKTPKKTTTRTRSKSDSATPRASAPRKRAAPTRRKATTTTDAPVVKRAVVRKAPTRTVPTQQKNRQPVLLYASLGGFLLVLGVSVAVGMSDSGQINVSSAIATRVQENPLSDSGQPIVVPTNNRGNERVIDSGLTPADPSAQVSAAPADTSLEALVEGEVLGETESAEETTDTTEPTETQTEAATEEDTSEPADTESAL
jgi:hypothetical protein